MTKPDFSVRGQRVLVVGAARSGVAAAHLLARRGALVTLTDAKSEIAEAAELRAAGVRLELGGHVAATFESAQLIVLSPGVPLELPELTRARTAGVKVIGELELASRWLRGPIVAITGTKGKSTTTTLVGRMLEAAGRRVMVGGNIGYPLSAQVDDSTTDTVHVVEASSFQLETTDTFRPWIAALLNFSPDHLDRHPDEASYASAKLRIFANQGPEDWAVVNADSPEAMQMAHNVRARVVTYGVDEPADVHVGRGFVWQRTSEGDVPLLPVAAVHLHGRHMLSNVVAATAISHLAGASGSSLAKALEDFRGLEHVMELVASRGGVRFINDSKATNVAAAVKSIESFDRVVAIVGGKFKGGNFGDLAAPLQAHGRAVVAIGEARPMVTSALRGVVPVVEAGTMAEAVRQAWDLALPDGVVLLAPACASFDMFRDYADRGRRFKDEVLRLISEA
ncbi:MAG TPA: UDP-N-acetylmuramoyl-L-alanine--D-glutamate ligase [Vicinamibacterales bacterium]|nr:UDP-N-acetylmuramoyl-L-alanine--D-glutamate ligase [Vicinamibacterales bacterium]